MLGTPEAVVATGDSGRIRQCLRSPCGDDSTPSQRPVNEHVHLRALSDRRCLRAGCHSGYRRFDPAKRGTPRTSRSSAEM